jgi:hypothetical protein
LWAHDHDLSVWHADKLLSGLLLRELLHPGVLHEARLARLHGGALLGEAHLLLVHRLGTGIGGFQLLLISVAESS